MLAGCTLRPTEVHKVLHTNPDYMLKSLTMSFPLFRPRGRPRGFEGGFAVRCGTVPKLWDAAYDTPVDLILARNFFLLLFLRSSSGSGEIRWCFIIIVKESDGLVCIITSARYIEYWVKPPIRLSKQKTRQLGNQNVHAIGVLPSSQTGNIP